MNASLSQLYEETKSALDEKVFVYNQSIIDKRRNLNDRAANPLYLKVSDEYISSPNKIMVFGQETNYWATECGNGGAYCGKIQDVTNIYDKFYLKNGFKSHKSPFWNEFKRIVNGTKKHNTSVIWNNINKIGRLGKGNIKSINDIQFEHFRVIKNEIEILKPSILLFFTGFEYDNFIRKQIGDFKTKAIIEGKLDEIQFENELSNLKCYRTFHPNYLYLGKMRKQVMDRLLEEVNKNYR